MQRLASGTLLVTIPGMHPPKDQAVRVARTALALRAACPGLAMVLATGRAEGSGLLSQRVGQRSDQTADQAARALRETAPGMIRVDAMTASLLAARFHIDDYPGDQPGQAPGRIPGPMPGGGTLIRERSREGTRTLLGKPTPWVGRQREMAA